MKLIRVPWTLNRTSVLKESINKQDKSSLCDGMFGLVRIITKGIVDRRDKL